MPEFLQTDLAIGYVDKDTGEVKATPYFEDLLFQYLTQMGGEEEDLIDQSTNIVNALPSALEMKISAIRKDVSSLFQLAEIARTAPIKNLEPRVIELEQRNVVPLNAKFSSLQKEVDALKQIQPDHTLQSKFASLLSFSNGLQQLITGLSSQHGFLQSIISDLAKGSDKSLTVTASASIPSDIDTVFVSGSSVTLTLTALGAYRKSVTIINKGSNSVTLATPGSELIQGSSTATLVAGNSIRLASDLTNWYFA